ncbi:polyhydroxyalkanoate granule-associated phasin [Variovorax sp. H27-G14]|uniref:polyhydroxyalkanoate granule-associated phasin n=1 Tax=Variovorax sp. H27-G14 TaxID=3111914 RepID=UPI0038FBF000
MSSLSSAARLANPLMQWFDLALKTHEMLLSSGSVIRMRTERMAKAGLTPSPADLAEFQLMGQEKLTAASESGMAMVKQWHSSQFSLANRAVQQWVQGTTAFLLLAGSVTPAQAVANGDAFVQSAAGSVNAASQLPGMAARIAREGLKPIHAAATSNARRLADLEA